MSHGLQPGQQRSEQTARRVAKNTIYLVLSEVASKAMMFVFFMLAARWLGAEKYGVFSFALAYVSMFAVFADLGLGVVSAREIARKPEDAARYVNNCLTIKLGVSVVLTALVIASAGLLHYPPMTLKVTAIASLFVLGNAIALYYGYVFQGFERLSLNAITRLVQTAVMLGGVMLMTRSEASVGRFAWLYVAGTGFGAFLSWLLSSLWLVRPGLRFDLGTWRPMLRHAIPVGVAAVFSMLYYWNGSAFLSKFRGDVEVGLFNAPFRLVLGLGFAAFAFASAIYPTMSRLHQTNCAGLGEFATTALRYMFVLAAMLGVVVTFLSRHVVTLVYGAEYMRSSAILTVLIWWVGFICLNAVLSNYFYAMDRPSVVTIQTAIALAVNLLLNVALIPALGAVGAAVSLVITEGLGTVLMLVRRPRDERRASLIRALAVLPRTTVAAAGASAVGMYLCRWNSVAGLAAAGAIGLFLLFAFRVLGRREFDVMMSLVGRRSG